MNFGLRQIETMKLDTIASIKKLLFFWKRLEGEAKYE